MPYRIAERGGMFAVVNTDTDANHGWTSKEKAEAQLRLLLAIEHNPHFVPRSAVDPKMVKEHERLAKVLEKGAKAGAALAKEASIQKKELKEMKKSTK